MNNASPTQAQARGYIRTYFFVIGLVVTFGLGVLADKNWQQNNVMAPMSTNASSSQAVVVNRALNHSSLDFNQFWQVWDDIKAKYVKNPVAESDLLYGAIKGMVAALKDPHSVYFTPQEAKDFNSDLSGKFEGIGAEIGLKDAQLVVVAPIPGSPAQKAGLKAGDKIVAINKEITAGMEVEAAVGKIRGPGGTTVVLSIIPADKKEPKDITITRAVINVPSVTLEMKPGTIAYVRINQFNEKTTPELSAFIKEIKQKPLKGVVLDLRNNPGGLLYAAITVASEWVDKGVIVSEKDVVGHEEKQYADGLHRLNGVKTIVLVNRGSASASEIVAGALQDYKLATIVGEKTFGKGSVQGVEDFADGSALKLTTAEWYTPNGKNINADGIHPDIEIKQEIDAKNPDKDNVLIKALEMLK